MAMKPDDPYLAEAWQRGYDAGVQAVQTALDAVVASLRNDGDPADNRSPRQ